MAKRIKVPAATFAKWETQETPLALTHLRELAVYLKRPLAAFLLPKPPEELPLPEDYRTLPGGKGTFERKTWLAIRKARRLQSIASELMRSMERDTKPQFSGARLSDDPGAVAQREREHLGISLEKQQGWKEEREALREWRSAIEHLNILTFQLRIPVKDVRGFSLGDEKPYVVAVSSSDAVQARIFTLFHEYAHLLLNNAGICAPMLETRTQRKEADVEKWCNGFSGSFLVPPQALPQVSKTTKLKDQALFDVLAETASKFKVSEQVVLRRLLDVGLVSRPTFNSAMDELEARPRKAKQKGGPPPARKCLAENGDSFSSLVLEARNRGLVTYADVSDFLDVRLKWLPEIESALMARAA
ncbi:MAG: ImmA/IrrE family metallo-endopeptidase [Acidobacteria bacterium]|nr:ImmA/IrrE family metallo-endopeptidase [Acidobacteriota bacterium]